MTQASYSGEGDERIQLQGQPRQKLARPSSQDVWRMPVVPATQEENVGGLQSKAGLRKVSKTLLKNKLKMQKGWRHGSHGL
jgi:hypothetical protein